MGILFSCCSKKREKSIVLMLVGLDNAGKTVAAKGLAGEPIDSVVPTVGFSAINLKYGNFRVKIYDVGGGPGIRGIWHKYFVDVHGVIFVIDSSDISRINEAKTVLENILSHEKISGKPVLILANKQDNECALDEIELIEKLDLESLVNEKQCPTLIECCVATEVSNKSKIDPGIKKGYEWLLNYISRNYKELDTRVKRDMKVQETIDKEMLMRKIERLKHWQQAESNLQDVQYYDYDTKEEDHTITKIQNGDGLIPTNGISTVSDEVQNIRPKSASQIVRDHLLLTDTSGPVSRHTARNKTSPMSLYDNKISQSAKLQRKIYTEQRRHLKSAGDSIFITNQSWETRNVSGPSGDNVDITQQNPFCTIKSSHSSTQNMDYYREDVMVVNFE